MTKNVSTVGVRVAATPAPAASPPAATAAAMTIATTMFFMRGMGLRSGVYADVSATEAKIIACNHGCAFLSIMLLPVAYV